jgi:DNA-binding SARP family transcriptional activator
VSTVRIYLFRDFSVERDGSLLTSFNKYKVKELFSYLLLNHTRPHRRETLTTLLWSETDPYKSQRNMRQTLWQLQRQLETCFDDEAQRLLLINGDWIQINPQVEIWCDVLRFRRAYERVQGVAGQALDHEITCTLREAVTLYQGELLEGWYQEWCLIERENLQVLFLMMLDKLMDYCESQHNYEEGIGYGMRALRLDLSRERTHRRMMRLYDVAGDRGSAMRQYELCATYLKKEFNEEPTKRTKELYERLSNNQPLTSKLVLKQTHRLDEKLSPSNFDFTHLLSHLAQLVADLDIAYWRIQQEIEAVTELLQGN